MELQDVWGKAVTYKGKFLSLNWTRLCVILLTVFVSLKEYGRGTGADCRCHVQKLNSLRGELLVVENKRAWTQW